MIINDFDRIRPMTLMSFFPKNRKLRLNEQSQKEISNKYFKVNKNNIKYNYKNRKILIHFQIKIQKLN
jgi:hypothetical protein